jgi:3-oxoacyl-[acyl-carrier protein] reductase
VDLDQTAVKQIMDGICHSGGKARALVANALEAADVARVVQQTVETCGRIDILVNAVGGSTIIPNSGATVDVLTLDEWQRLLLFNLNGTFLFCNAVVPIMKCQCSGKIINISSMAGRGLSQGAAVPMLLRRVVSSPSRGSSRSSLVLTASLVMPLRPVEH